MSVPNVPVGYCGLYCGFCCRGRLKKAARDLLTTTDTYGFEKIASVLKVSDPDFKNYSESDRVLKAMNRFFDSFGSCPTCANGGGDPNCTVRICCREKAYSTCLDCISMDSCEKLINVVVSKRRFRALEAAMSL